MVKTSVSLIMSFLTGVFYLYHQDEGRHRRTPHLSTPRIPWTVALIRLMHGTHTGGWAVPTSTPSGGRCRTKLMKAEKNHVRNLGVETVGVKTNSPRAVQYASLDKNSQEKCNNIRQRHLVVRTLTSCILLQFSQQVLKR